MCNTYFQVLNICNLGTERACMFRKNLKINNHYFRNRLVFVVVMECVYCETETDV